MIWGTRLTHDQLHGAIHAWRRASTSPTATWHSVCGLLRADKIVCPRKELRGREHVYGCQRCSARLTSEEGPSRG